jgi:multiple sugar transport system substrate-binding protein
MGRINRRTFLKGAAALGAAATLPRIAHAQGATTIEYWDFVDPNLQNPRSQMLKKNLARFEELNPSIKVKFVRLPFAEIDKRLVQGAASGVTPDVIKIYNSSLALHVDAGGLEPLDQLAAKVDKNDWILPWDSTVFDGKKMALPYEHRVWITYYRKDILDRVGVPVPKSWDDMCKIAPKLVAANVTPYGMGFSKADNASILAEFFNNILFQVGTEVVDAKGNAAFGNDKGLKFFQLISDLTKCKALPAEAPEYTYDAGREAVVAGRAATTTLGTHQFVVARAAGPGDKLQWAPGPSFTGEAPPSGVYNWNLTIGRYSKNKEAAWKFLEYMTSTEAQVNLAKGGENPSRKSTYRDPWFSTPEAKLLKEWAEFMQKQGKFRRFPPTWNDLTQILAEECQNIFLKGLAPREAMNRVVKRFNESAAKS